MKKGALVGLVLSFLFGTDVFCQSLTWEKTYPIQRNQSVTSVFVDQSAIYLAGTSTKLINSLQENFISFIKTNLQGDTVKLIDFQLPGFSNYGVTNVFKRNDNKLVFIGRGGSSTPGVILSFLLVLDTNGVLNQFNVYNQLTYGGSEDAIQLPDGGFLITGARNFFSGGDIDIFLIRTDSSGSIRLDTSFVKAMPQQAFSIEPLYDGSYLIGGVTGTAQGPAAYALQVDLWGRVIRDTVIQTPTNPFNNTRVFFKQLADDSWSISGLVGSSNVFLYRVGPQFQPIAGSYSTSLPSNSRFTSYPTADSGFLYVRTLNANTISLRKYNRNQTVAWDLPFSLLPQPYRYYFDLTFDGQGSVIGGGIIDGSMSGNSDDYYYSKISNAGQPFFKNLCRNLPQVSMSSELDSLSQSYRVYNTSSSGLQHNPLMRWSWYLPLLNQTVTDSVLVLPATISSPFPVELTVSHYYGCSATASANVFSVLGNHNENTSASEIRLYPNPAKGAMYLQNARPGRYEIHDLQGRTLQTGILTAEPQQMIDLSNIKPGLYLLRLSNARESSTHKLLVE